MFKGMKSSSYNNQHPGTTVVVTQEDLVGAGISVSAHAGNSTVSVEVPKQESVNFSTSAFSVVHLGGAWVVVEIPIDPVTRKTGEWKVVQEDGTKMGAQERFKISEAMKLFA